MRHITLLNERSDPSLLLHDFDEDISTIERFHRYVIEASDRDFRQACDEISLGLDPEQYDGGDVVGYAEERLGITPWDVASHSGLMAVSRATSLVEVMFARMAAQTIQEPDYWIFPDNGLWSRQREEDFYSSVLRMPFKTNAGAFKAIRGLRDLYAHGYGVPASEHRRSTLGQQLVQHIPCGPPTELERRLGYDGAVFFFGWDSSYSARERQVTSTWSSTRRADLSPLAAYRILVAAKEHVHAAHAALQQGLRSDLDTNLPKFVRNVHKEMERRARRRGTADCPSPPETDVPVTGPAADHQQ